MLFKILLQNNLNPWADQATCGYSLETKPLQVKQQDTQLNQNFSVSLLAHNTTLAELLTRGELAYSSVRWQQLEHLLLGLVTRTSWGKPLTLVWHSPCAQEAVALTYYTLVNIHFAPITHQGKLPVLSVSQKVRRCLIESWWKYQHWNRRHWDGLHRADFQ